jgi:cytochrome c553
MPAQKFFVFCSCQLDFIFNGNEGRTSLGVPPRAASDGVPSLVGLGQTIYQQGMPEENIVACVVCHGPNGEGVRDIPRLGGLDSTYLKRRLEQWNEGYHAAAGPPMISIASKLSDDQIEALASYLSFIK